MATRISAEEVGGIVAREGEFLVMKAGYQLMTAKDEGEIMNIDKAEGDIIQLTNADIRDERTLSVIVKIISGGDAKLYKTEAEAQEASKVIKARRKEQDDERVYRQAALKKEKAAMNNQLPERDRKGGGKK